MLWWSKMVRQYLGAERMMNWIMKAAAVPPQLPSTNATRVGAVREAKGWYRGNILLLSRCGNVALVPRSRGRILTPLATTHCKKFLSLASPSLLCCNASIYIFAFYLLLSVVLL